MRGRAAVVLRLYRLAAEHQVLRNVQELDRFVLVTDQNIQGHDIITVPGQVNLQGAVVVPHLLDAVINGVWWWSASHRSTSRG